MLQVSQIIIRTDGGSRGNPGPSASAFVVEKEEKIIFKNAKYIGVTTNNVAEYTAVLNALNWCIENKENLRIQNVKFILDSELVVRQLNGIYKVRDLILRKLFADVNNKVNKLKIDITFTHVLRAKNKIADHLVNAALDKKI